MPFRDRLHRCLLIAFVASLAWILPFAAFLLRYSPDDASDSVSGPFSNRRLNARSLSVPRKLSEPLFVRYKQWSFPKRSSLPTSSAHYGARIVGGTDVTPEDRYPYIAALFDSERDQFLCGGSLVTPDIVLTAAHCLEDIDTVVLGRYNIEDTDVGESMKVAKAVQHPNFRPRAFNLDLALLKLPRESSFAPVTINSDPNVPVDEQELTVMGWGLTSATGEISPVLQETQVFYQTNEQCRSESSYEEGRISDAMMCASAPGKDACGGDSGGPLIIKGSNPDASLDVIVGVTSFGKGCAEPEFPGVYARTSYQIEWIREVVCNDLSPSTCNYLYNCFDETTPFAVEMEGGGSVMVDCEWVERRAQTRCLLYGDKCPATCGNCPVPGVAA